MTQLQRLKIRTLSVMPIIRVGQCQQVDLQGLGKENTRDEIYAAFKRKEVYATTGPRIGVQVFAGWDLSDITYKNFQDLGYKLGVPMGGDLSSISKNSGPSFAIKVVKDPIGANLDRVQIVKGWIDRDGKSEKIYDVAWSDDRDFDSSGQLEPVGNTVDLTNGMHENTIGETDFLPSGKILISTEMSHHFTMLEHRNSYCPSFVT